MNELIIEDLKLGDGKSVVKGALITTHYTGWLEDGTEFDSSLRKNKPFQCVIGTGRVIKGWAACKSAANANCKFPHI